MKKIRIYLALTLLLSLAAGYGLRMAMPERQADERAFLKEIIPDVSFSEKTGAPPHYLSHEGLIAFNSYDIVPSVRGYAGPIKVLLLLSPDGKIAGIRIVDHRETENYVHYMETADYLSRFVGKSITDPFEVDKDIDGISRATVSVEALAQTVRESSRAIGSEVLGIEAGQAGPVSATDFRLIWYCLLFSGAIAFYFLTRKKRGLLRGRDIFLISSLPVLGIILSSPFSILHVFNLVLLRPSSALLWLTVVGSVLVSIILAGRFYCGWLCPFGALSEFIGRLPSRKWTIPAELDDRWRVMKYLLLGLITVLVLVTGKTEYGNYETYVTLFSFHGSFLSWTLVVVMLLANLRVERFWCRYLCPVAAFTGLLSRRSDGYPSRKDCPMGNKPNPLISECIRCNRCYVKRGDATNRHCPDRGPAGSSMGSSD